MKYDGLRKLERNRQLVRYRMANPGLSHKEISQVFGISRARVTQLLKENTQDVKPAGLNNGQR